MNDDQNKPKMDELVAGHDYDGIQEFNNPAPFWWQLFFYISIVWAVAYVAYYIFMGGPTLQEELTSRLQEIQSVQTSEVATGPDESVLLAAVGDSEKVAVGAKVFVEKCAACHAADGGGVIGPNLTDNYWIHGQGKLAAIYQVIELGVSDKGMPPWGAVLSADEMVGVTVYVKSLKGHPVATVKPPQGDLVNE